MNLKGRVVAVSGSKGFVGRHVLARLVALGADVRELTLEDGVDITEWQQVSRVGRFDAFVHLAAQTFVPQSFNSPREMLSNNLVATISALEACRKFSAKMVFASAYVYGEPQRLPICEDHPLVATNPYTESKIIGERLCSCYHRDFGVPCTILRAFNIYGHGQNSRFLIPTIISQARTGTVRLRSGKPRRDFIHVEDVAEAYVRAVGLEPEGFSTYNIGSGISHSVAEIAGMIREEIGKPVAIIFSEEVRKGEVLETVADIGRAKSHLGWAPSVPLGRGLASCVHKAALASGPSSPSVLHSLSHAPT
jgi:nucleoside-diphosphate-sugar epimerase